MATIKNFTDLEQSKKLAEILPLESADMWWLYVTAQGKHIAMMHEEPDPHYIARMESYGIKDAAIRCWSLSALLGVLPQSIKFKDDEYYLRFMKEYVEYANDEVSITGRCLHTTGNDNLVDACFEMILKLHELKML